MSNQLKYNQFDKQLEQPKQKVQCKLCSCEGVDGTVLCRDHLDGFELALSTLGTGTHFEHARRYLRVSIKQKADK